MMTKDEMVIAYDNNSVAHDYILGFVDHHEVYVAYCKADILPMVMNMDIASRGAGNSLRFKPTKAQKNYLRLYAEKLITLCSEEEIEVEASTTIYNRGEIFEKKITEMYGQEWHKDNVPFTVDGDITVNGIKYQIKYNKATFCNEKQLVALG